jgi:hypothetical protein
MCKPPSALAFHVCCSHTETHSSTDSEGNTTYYEVMVVTHSSEHPLEWSSFVDSSAFAGVDLLGLQAVVRRWAMADASLLEVDSEMSPPADSDGSIEAEKQRLLMSHRMLDVSCSVTLVPCVPAEFKPSMSVQIHALPATVSLGAFWLASWLFLTIPYVRSQLATY